MRSTRPFLFLFGALASAFAADPAPEPLRWDAMEKTVVAQPGDAAADFVFKATNASRRAVTITAVLPSCGCTTVDVPPAPWVIAPGASGEVRATVDFGGKEGMVAKSLFLETSEGRQTLFLRVDIPSPDETMRLRNRELAQKNRQAVFRGECASCHVAPGVGRTGEALFTATCGVCHLAGQRAAMVPDLLTAREHRDAAWWRTWISEGKEGTLMPAFAEKNDGPLTPAQIESLVAFALSHLPTEPRKN